MERSEQTAVRRRERRARPEWAWLVEAAEAELGRPWKTLVEAHEDWGRDGVMFVAVRYGRYQLAEVVRPIPGLKYAAAAAAVKRFAMAVEHDDTTSRFVTRLKSDTSHVYVRPHGLARRNC